MALAAAPSDAIAFLSAWDPRGPWTIISIHPASRKTLCRVFHVDQSEALSTWITELPWNFYFIPNRTTSNLTTSPTKEQITHALTLHVDLDLPKAGPYSAQTPENFALLLHRLQSLTPPPNIIINSGGGYQAYWTLTTPLPTPEYTNHIEETNKAIEREINADNCHNINRLMRLPGTINVPTTEKLARGRAPALAFVLEADWTRSYSLDDDRPHNGEESSGHDYVEPLSHIQNAADVSSRIRSDVAELPVKWQKRILQGDAAGYDNDRSRLVLAVITYLMRRGWPDESVYALITDTAYLVSSHVLENERRSSGYARRQLTRAKALIEADWHRTERGGIDPLSQDNIRRALAALDAKFTYDTFAMRGYVNGYGPKRHVDDDTTIDLRLTVDTRFKFMPSRDLFHDVVRHLCISGSYHPVLDYLNKLTWDNIKRIDTWLIDYGEAEDTPYIRAVSRLILIAAVRRVRSPGCKFDEMLVLINPNQGTDKSSALQALAVNMDWFTDSLPLNATGKQIIERLSGKWIVEASDLAGMSKSDREELKDFLSRRSDRDRLAYDRYATEMSRQSVFFGTTNSEVFLKDDQNRRFWPVRVGRLDVAGLTKVVQQLWAEAAYMESQGESIRLDTELWPVAAQYQADARATEPWVELIDDVLNDITGKVHNADIWKIINKPGFNRTQEDNRRMGEAMRELGWERARARLGGPVRIVYMRGTTDERQRIIYIHRDPIDNSVTAGYAPQLTDISSTHLNEDENNELPL